jgi:ElaB/YqjD/DUF883 family membrane-anchored ribosome-binding protein
MNRDSFEGAARSAVGYGEELAGQALKDKSMTNKGHNDDILGKAQSALGSAKDAVQSGVDAAASIDFSQLRDDIAKLTQTVGDLVQKQASSAREQVMDAVGAAGDNLSQSASAAQDKFASIEQDMGARIQKNPWGAVMVAALIGLLIGKMS